MARISKKHLPSRIASYDSLENNEQYMLIFGVVDVILTLKRGDVLAT